MKSVMNKTATIAIAKIVIRVAMLCAILVSVNVDAQVTLVPAVSTMPVNGIQTVTSRVVGGDDRVTWTAPGATIYGSGSTIAIKKTTPGSVTVTATSVADGSKTATATITFTAAPTPRLNHPRIWVNSDTLPALRAWAVNTNPVFQNGLLSAVTQAKTKVDASWTWTFSGGTGTPNSSAVWVDPGDAYSLNYYTTENYMGLLAFYSMLAPDQPTKDAYGLRARDMLMYIMNNANNPYGADSLWRDPKISWWDRARTSGWAWGATVDWLQAGNYLSAGDKTVIATVFKKWGKAQNDSTKGGSANEWVAPMGVVNDPSLLANGTSLCCSLLQWKADNRNMGAFQAQVYMALALDSADDPKTNAGDPWDAYYSDGSANTVRGYLKSALGAWLYQQWALFEDADVVGSVLGVSKTTYRGIGKAAGGFSVEGSLYDQAMGEYLAALYALHTSGNDDPAVWGPQVSMYRSSYWDLRVHSLLTELTPAQRNIAGFTSYEAFTSRDVYTLYWRDTDHQSQLAIIAATDNYDGMSTSTRAAAAKWMLRYGVQRGTSDADFYANVGGHGPQYFPSTEFILAFLAFDPALGQTPPAPHGNYTTNFVSPTIGRVLSRKDWTTNSSAFAYYCPWLQTNHQVGNCGTIDFYRKGEWLAKYRSGYYWAYENMHPEIHNTLAIRNAAVESTYSGYQKELLIAGGQWPLGLANSSPTVKISTGANYTFANADATGLYNYTHPFFPERSANDVLHASRSVFYLKDSDRVVIYDRAKTSATGEFKRFTLNLAGTVTTASNVVTLTSTSAAQKMYVTALLPNSGTTSVTTPPAWVTPSNRATGEPTTIQYTITDTANPLDIRFLNVMEAVDTGTAQSTTTLIQSSAGTNFDGAKVGTTLVMFKKTLGEAVSTVTFAASGATTHYVANLTANHTYGISATGAPSTAVTDSAGVLTFAATGTGNVVVTDGSVTTYALTIATTGSGTGTTLGAGTFTSGSTVTASAVADSGSIFMGWSGGGCAGAGDCTLTLSADTTITATFSLAIAPDYVLTLTKSGTGQGTVGGAGTYSSGTVINATATPSVGSTFTGWSGACTGMTCSITLNANKTATATFNLDAVQSGGANISSGLTLSGAVIR